MPHQPGWASLDTDQTQTWNHNFSSDDFSKLSSIPLYFIIQECSVCEKNMYIVIFMMLIMEKNLVWSAVLYFDLEAEVQMTLTSEVAENLTVRILSVVFDVWPCLG
jgi:hypothetical protein